MSLEVQEAQRVIELEAQTLLDLKDQIGPDFKKAIDLIYDTKGKVVLTGMGKSGLIARKIASTLSSTGTPSFYLHPSESSHGDLGVLQSGDTVIAISNSGDTPELDYFLKHVTRKNIKMIGITGNPESRLGVASAVVLKVAVKEHACPLGLAPTCSSTATLAMGDAIAVTLLKKRGFKAEDFAEFHPGGSLGKRLLTQVADLMHPKASVPMVTGDEAVQDLLIKMSEDIVRGIAGVVNNEGKLVGAITDGDIRRSLKESKDITKLRARDIMSESPKTIIDTNLVEKAIQQMQEHAIQSLFVTEESSGKVVGLIHIQDLIKNNVR